MDNMQPLRPLRTERSLLKYFFLGLLTLGIYDIVVECHISEELNEVASRHDGKHTMHYLWIFFLLSWLTCGIANLVWYHRTSARMGDELRRRGIDYNFGASDFWLWNILGSLIFVGPFIYVHKRMEAMNYINADYNSIG